MDWNIKTFEKTDTAKELTPYVNNQNINNSVKKLGIDRSKIENKLQTIEIEEQRLRLSAIMHDIIQLRNDRRLDDEAFAGVMEIIISKYVENEVNERIKVFINKPIFHNFDWALKRLTADGK